MRRPRKSLWLIKILIESLTLKLASIGNKRRGLALSLAIGVTTLGTTGCSLGYLMQQGQGQLALLLKREPLERVMADPTLDAETRDRLEIARDAKHFAETRLGLKPSRSYTSVVRLERDAVTYVVAGAPKDRLEPYLWWFPIVGNVPYKGYFDKRNAEREKAWLESKGLDAYLRGVSAYSMLGIVPDPLYSPMLKASRAGLANVIIHELTHGTVFLSGKPSFNEAFATFVGDEGARMFLEARYGAASEELRQAAAIARDQERFGAVLAALAADLKALYALPLADAERMARREARFGRAKEELQGIAFETSGYRNVASIPLNNAYLTTFMTYYGQSASFEAVYEKLGRDLPAFVAFFRDRVAKAPDPAAFVEATLSAE